MAYGQQSQDSLFRICTEEICELGSPSGYINQHGDTIISIGRYFYCYTDTADKMAIVQDTNGQCLALDNLGKLLFYVYWSDMGPDRLSDGLFRIIVNNKIGFANAEGKVIIKPQFACANQFNDGKAQVTYDCELMSSGEHTSMKSSTWFTINTYGERISSK